MSIYLDKIQYLSDAVKNKPEYTEIANFFISIYKFADSFGDTGLSFSSDISLMNDKNSSGKPLISVDDIAVDCDRLSSFVSGVIQTCRDNGKAGDEELNKLESAILKLDIDGYKTLFAAILKRERKIIDDFASTNSILSPLVEYILEIPLKFSLEKFEKKVNEIVSVSQWDDSFCPVCGSRAAMAELSATEEGKRYLSCSACNHKWGFKRIKCPYCGNEELDSLFYFLVGDEPTRVDGCKRCSRYIKTKDARKGDAEIPLDIVDLLTIHIDLVASKEGVERGK